MNSDFRSRIVFIVGCTASGKGTVGRALAEKYGAEILSVDSMKVYTSMDIGTAKPDPDVRARIPHHLIDVVDPSDSFSAGKFVEHAEAAIADVHRRGRVTFAVGGTVLYLKALTEGLFEGPGADPELRAQLQKKADEIGGERLLQELAKVDPPTAERLHYNDLKRIVRALEVYQLTGRPISTMQEQFGRLREDYDMLFVGLRQEKDELNRRINERVRRMIQKGLVDEVRALYGRTPPMSPQARDAVGYAEIIEHFQGNCDLPTALEKVKINTRRLAKHQRTWLRRMGHIQWFDIVPGSEPAEVIERVREHVEPFLGR